MTYDELLETWKRYDTEWKAYQDSVFQVIDLFMQAWRKHLAAPARPVFRLIPTDFDRQAPEGLQPLPLVVSFDSQGIALVTLEVTISEGTPRASQLCFFLDMSIFRTKSEWHWKAFEKAETKVLTDRPTPEELDDLCSYITAAMSKDFEGHAEDSIGKVPENTIGFRVG